MNKHEMYMREALNQAQIAYDSDEVPVGAIIVYEDRVIARAYNTNFHDRNALVHAEIKAIDQACKVLKTSDLSKCTLYVTLEPCMMCYGALINAKIKTVYFGAFDIKQGAILSNQFYKDEKNITWHTGLLEADCGAILSKYFASKRGN